MEGNPPDNLGIIPRTLYSLFEGLESMTTESSVRVSFLELYNEELKDLLGSGGERKLKMYEDLTRKVCQVFCEYHVACEDYSSRADNI